jgi:hypothetical protein
MVEKFEDVKGWLDKAGVPESAQKWIARAGIVVGPIVLMAWLWKFLGPTVAPGTEKLYSLPDISQQAGNNSTQIGAVQGNVIFNNQVPQLATPSYNQPSHTVLPKSISESAPQTANKDNKDDLHLSPCDGILGDYNFDDDSTQQHQAWDLLEKTLAEMQREKKNGIDMRLIEEAHHDWNKAHSREAFVKFSAALCDAVSKPNPALQRNTPQAARP